jgi:hypothetical protein
MAALTRNERRQGWAMLRRVERAEEDLDTHDEEFAEIKSELKSQTRLLTTILITLLGSSVAIIGTLLVTGPK